MPAQVNLVYRKKPTKNQGLKAKTQGFVLSKKTLLEENTPKKPDVMLFPIIIMKKTKKNPFVFQMPEAVEGKKKVDRVIDICGTSPKGTGLQNLRECIIETKWKYDVAPEEKQVVWKRMILNFMERWVNGNL